MDLYKILQVNPDATEQEIRSSYKKLVLKWHPDKNDVHNKKEAENKFIQINDAYKVLIDPHSRAEYDKSYKETKRKRESDSPKSEARSQQNTRKGANYKPQPGFSARQFSSSKPDYSAENQSGIRKPSPVFVEVACTLTELYHGGNKTCQVQKYLYNDKGEKQYISVTMQVYVKPGSRHGSNVIVEGQGNVARNGKSGDIFFRIRQEDHSTYTRSDDNLIINKELSLFEAIFGTTINILTLDGRSLRVPAEGPIFSGSQRLILTEGMPKTSQPSQKGNLIIKFKVRKTPMTATQKNDIRKALGE